MSGKLTVHLRVNDPQTKQPLPVRVSISDASGRFYAPFGRFVDFPIGKSECVGGQLFREDRRWFYLDGGCEIALPTQTTLGVWLSAGPQFRKLQQLVTLGPGQMTLRFELERVNFTHEEWLCGDARVHLVEPHTAILESEAEGVQITQLLATPFDFPSQDGTIYRDTPFLAAFSGSKPRLQTDRTTLAVNTLNLHPYLGKVGLLNTHRGVFPLSFGFIDESDDWSICDWCDQAHRKTGLVTWVDPSGKDGEVFGGESLIAALLGKIDAVEISEHSPRFLSGYYSLLNSGLRLPLVGASGKTSNRTPIGSLRTWTPRNDEALAGWIEAIRRGETVVSSGLPVRFTVADQPPGGVVRWANSDQPIPMRIDSEIASDVPLKLIVNGKVRPEIDPRSGEILLPEGGWLAVRAVGENTFLHSSPVYVEVANQPRFALPEAINGLLTRLEAVRLWIETVGRFELEKSKAHLLTLLQRAEAKLRNLAS